MAAADANATKGATDTPPAGTVEERQVQQAARFVGEADEWELDPPAADESASE